MHLINAINVFLATTAVSATAVFRRQERVFASTDASLTMVSSGTGDGKMGLGAGIDLSVGIKAEFNGTGKITKSEKRRQEESKQDKLGVKDKFRDLEFDVKSDKVRLRSRLANHSSYRFDVSTEGGIPRIRAFFHTFDNDTDTKYKSTYMLAITRVVEVNDTISWKDSTSFVSFLGAANKVWSSFQVGAMAIDNSSMIFSANTTFSDPKTSGFNFTLSSFVSQSITRMPGTNGTFSPNALKYSIGMVGFPFKYNNSHLVIIKTMWSRDTSTTLASADRTLLVGSAETGNKFTWNSTAEYQTNKTGTVKQRAVIDVESSTAVDANIKNPDTIDNEEKPKLIVCHIRINGLTNNSEILWDPEMAVAVDATVQGTGTGSGSGAAKGAVGILQYVLALAAVFAFVL
jgi:hypothetical protein